jgi:hypothetical protein
MRDSKSIVPSLVKTNSPIIEECKKPPIKLIKYQSYGLKKLYKRLDEK